MNPEPSSKEGSELFDPEIVQALNGLSASASLAVAQRTRRAVREAATNLREDRARRRRNKGFTLLLAVSLLTLLTPALWSGVDEIFAGEHFSDLPAMVTLFALTLFSAIIAALIASWKSHQPLRYGRRNF
ncbi:hypothetical protein ACPOL_1536 [Acidisarcina polymorpha]|uniref:Uncharacterized protein n=1 Tax=Acidisarcina polymorpha TaxID=2211140 RepID=A0A2Z5FVV0_9BACT|nr:hypothetical protein [Acidisarcina polymorpha]AXC10882.1 hypothetical protein ACPOL_1536 [Acidisarcina polymorpha]